MIRHFVQSSRHYRKKYISQVESSGNLSLRGSRGKGGRMGRKFILCSTLMMRGGRTVRSGKEGRREIHCPIHFLSFANGAGRRKGEEKRSISQMSRNKKSGRGGDREQKKQLNRFAIKIGSTEKKRGVRFFVLPSSLSSFLHWSFASYFW